MKKRVKNIERIANINNISKVIGLGHKDNGKLTVYADGRTVRDIVRVGDRLMVVTNLKEEGNLVLWLGGDWLYQSHPKTPINGGKALQWQTMPRENVARSLVAPESWRSWSVS